ncbi:MAG: hypothetical protein V1913_18380 [Fibrobacterota bacterium]
MTALELSCPSCRQRHTLALKNTHAVLLLNCPGCGAVLLHYLNTTYQVSRSEIDDLARSRQLKGIHALLERVSRHKQKKMSGVVMFMPRRVSKKGLKKGAPLPEVISRDDIFNLMIDLHTSGSVAEFLNKLE